jgi:hypothetical protein
MEQDAVEMFLDLVRQKRQRGYRPAYLPERRHFWARQCAISALAMRGNGKTRHSLWKQMALVGRDIASDICNGCKVGSLDVLDHESRHGQSIEHRRFLRIRH